MSRTSDEVFFILGKNAAVVGHLDNYLAVLEPEEESKLHTMAEAALFDDTQRIAACVQFGRLEMVREFRRNLASFVKQHNQQYTR